MGRAFLRHLFENSSTLDEAAAAAKAQGESNYRGSWILFGDPTLQLVDANGVGPKRGCGCGSSGAPVLLLALAVALLAGSKRAWRRSY